MKNVEEKLLNNKILTTICAIFLIFMSFIMMAAIYCGIKELGWIAQIIAISMFIATILIMYCLPPILLVIGSMILYENLFGNRKHLTNTIDVVELKYDTKTKDDV
jgi:hypothetical protein